MRIETGNTNIWEYSSTRKAENKNQNATNKSDFAHIMSSQTNSKSDNSDTVITDKDLYNRLVERYGKDTHAIARELVKNNAVNPKNINPRNCTLQEMQILEASIGEGKEKSVKVASFMNASRIATKNDRLNGAYDLDSKVDWIKKVHEFAQSQIDLGNEDFIKDGTYDAVSSYIDKLLAYGKQR